MIGMGLAQTSMPEGTPRVSRLRDTVMIVPAYREEAGIGPVVRELREAIDPVILVVNRPGNDGTESMARKQGAVVIGQSGRGKGDAMRLGLDYVHANYPEIRFIGFTDADCTYPAFPLAKMRAILESATSVGMVVAQRDNVANNGATSRFFSMGNRLLGTAHRILNRVSLRDPLSGLRLVRADAIRGWVPTAHGFDVECELNCYVHNVRRLQISEVSVPYRERVGTKKLGFRHGFLILGRMISLAFRRSRPRMIIEARSEPTCTAVRRT
jgi:glycosyltransferase involved in cell wall biosynthesis